MGLTRGFVYDGGRGIVADARRRANDVAVEDDGPVVERGTLARVPVRQLDPGPCSRCGDERHLYSRLDREERLCGACVRLLAGRDR